MARSANGASATWEAGRSPRRRRFPTAARGRVSRDLRNYLARSRQNEFVDNLCRKLLVYALGRGLTLSDEPLIKTMKSKLAADGYRFESLISSIVTSRQFLERRGRDDDLSARRSNT